MRQASLWSAQFVHLAGVAVCVCGGGGVQSCGCGLKFCTCTAVFVQLSHSLDVLYVCLPIVCLPLRGEAMGWRGSWTGDVQYWWWGHFLGCIRNLSLCLLKRKKRGEPVRLLHMLAWVTCLFGSGWTFGPASKASTPWWLLHCSTCLPLSTCSLHVLGHLSKITCISFICCFNSCLSCFGFSLWPHIYSSLCLASVSPDKRLAQLLPSNFYLFLVCKGTPSTSQANQTFRSPTHTYWTAHLSPVQIWKREKNIQEGEEWNGKIARPLVTGRGAEKNTAQLSKPP